VFEYWVWLQGAMGQSGTGWLGAKHSKGSQLGFLSPGTACDIL